MATKRPDRPEDPVVRYTIRLRASLRRAVEHRAIDRDTTGGQIVTEALQFTYPELADRPKDTKK